MMNSVINLSGVTKIFNNTITAVSNISFDFERGSFYAIKGPSGSGKSILLHMIGTLDSPSSGSVRIYNNNIAELNENDKAIIRRDNIGFVFQFFMLNPKLKAFENVMLPMLASKSDFAECKKRSIELLEMCGLKNRINHYPHQLSGGEQQRVSVARALANEPGIILADEPTGNLDNENEIALMKKFKELSELGTCIIIVTHNDSVSDYADKILTMSYGSLIDVWDREVQHGTI